MTLTHSAIGLVVIATLGAGVFIGLTGPVAGHTSALAALTLGAAIVAFFDGRRSSTSDDDAMQPAFVVVFLALLVLGPLDAMVVAATVGIAHGLAEAEHPRRDVRTLGGAATGVAGMYAAGAAHHALGGTVGAFVWPQQGLPIAAAVYSATAWSAARLPDWSRRSLHGNGSPGSGPRACCARYRPMPWPPASPSSSPRPSPTGTGR